MELMTEVLLTVTGHAVATSDLAMIVVLPVVLTLNFAMAMFSLHGLFNLERRL